MKKTVLCFILISLFFCSYCNDSEDGNNLLILSELMDVHGAGAQRSDPKTGNPTEYPNGHGPQGDVVYIYNCARCVRENSSISDTYSIVDTGQDKCYDTGTSGEITSPSSGQSFYGQDAQYTGLTPSYTDNGNGTITDNVTGLMWQKAFENVAWADAESDADADTTGGYSDWRVPTIKELYSLIKFNGSTGMADPGSSIVPDDAIPYLDTDFFNFEYGSSPKRYIDAQYISSTSYVSTVMNNQDAFFGVNFADGRIKGYPKEGNPVSSTYYARYVRGNANYGVNSFSGNGDDTITDDATGLMWMKIDSGHSGMSSNVSGYTRTDGFLTWEEALHFCETLTFAGHSDWRLPNAKELHAIVDYTRSPDTTNSAAIDILFSTTSITDPGGDIDYPYFWASTTHLDGPNIGEYAIYITFGEAEGYMNPFF